MNVLNRQSVQRRMVDYGAYQVREVADTENDLRKPCIAEALKADLEYRPFADRKQGLREDGRVWSEPSSSSTAENDRLHESLIGWLALRLEAAAGGRIVSIKSSPVTLRHPGRTAG